MATSLGSFRRACVRTLVIACAAASVAVGGSSQANAGGLVEPSNLTPAPPQGAECRQHGDSVLCRTRFAFDDGPVPVMDLPCGTVYEIVTIPRNVYTEYVDGLLVGRHVTSHIDGVWALSPTADGPTVRISGGWNWRTVLTVAGDESTAQITTHGNLLKLGGGLSRYANVAGIFYPGDVDHRGPLIISIFDSPQAHVALCAALAS